MPDIHGIRFDPTSPAYRKQIRKDITFMLSPDKGCLNADGLKTDYQHMVPFGYDLEIHDPRKHGVELLKEMSMLLYREIKRIKPDAMYVGHTCNSYFTECVDVMRLNDIFSVRRRIFPAMFHRWKVAKIVDPSWLIDMDNYPAYYREGWIEYMRKQIKLGIPSLYYVTRLEMQERIREADYRLISKLWAQYRKLIGSKFKIGRRKR